MSVIRMDASFRLAPPPLAALDGCVRGSYRGLPHACAQARRTSTFSFVSFNFLSRIACRSSTLRS
jgi:hypothetical protein